MPADASEKLEAAMRDALPHLFEHTPDLLYQLVTLVSPAQLKARLCSCTLFLLGPKVQTMPRRLLRFAKHCFLPGGKGAPWHACTYLPCPS